MSRFCVIRCLAFVLLVVMQKPAAMGAEPATIQIEAISLTKADALWYLDVLCRGSDPVRILSDLRQLVPKGEAQAVAKAVLRQALPSTATHTEKPFKIEMAASALQDGVVNFDVVVVAAGQPKVVQLVAAASARPGVPVFLGTLEPEDFANLGRTWLVFLTVSQGR